MLERTSTAIQVREADSYVVWFQFDCEIRVEQIVYVKMHCDSSLLAWNFNLNYGCKLSCLHVWCDSVETIDMHVNLCPISSSEACVVVLR